MYANEVKRFVRSSSEKREREVPRKCFPCLFLSVRHFSAINKRAIDKLVTKREILMLFQL